jgi:hypothetical protein
MSKHQVRLSLVAADLGDSLANFLDVPGETALRRLQHARTVLAELVEHLPWNQKAHLL